jgi:AcrR family transcriptional regulator
MSQTGRQHTTALRRKQLLAEAAQVIGERGYFGFGLQELADRCGITKAGLLHHFGSKERLLVELLRERDRHNSVLVVALQTNADFKDTDTLTRDGVVSTLRAIVSQSIEQPEMLRLYAMLSLEALNPRHPAHAFFAAREAATRDLFSYMLAPHFENPGPVALRLLASMKGLEQEWLRTPDAFDLLIEWDAIVRQILW